jgi:release factor glutamine methyltransferase
VIKTGHEPLGELELLLTQAGITDAAAEAAIIWRAATREAGDDAAARAMEMATGRARGTPLPYVTGRVQFMGIEVSIAPGALIPREETELLGQTAVELLNRTAAGPRVIDMCCGSGNLACGIAMAIPAASVWASDLTAGAVSVAATNVNGLGVSKRVTLVQGDLFAPLESLGLEGTIDAVVCNPPYISSGKLKKERAELLSHEPIEAFDGGPYGVSFFQKVIKGALAFLKPGGSLLFEIGQGQARQVSLLFTRANAYEDAWTASDASGEPRVVGARKK